MIPYVNTMLVAWGRWAARGSDGGIGWASVSPMFKDAPSGNGYGSKMPLGVGDIDDDCEFTDSAVRRLCDDDKLLLVQAFVRRMKVKDIAAANGWHRQRVSERLNAVGVRFLGHMNDVAAGC